VINVGSNGGAASSLGVTGSVTASGTVNLNTGCSLGVAGSVGVSGALNMYGGALTAGALTLSGGTLTTNGGGGSGDSISAPLTNNGTVTFAGTLHTLTLTGDYTQGSAGTLIFRVANGATNDVFTISGGATLAGTLTITAIGTLTAGQT